MKLIYTIFLSLTLLPIFVYSQKINLADYTKKIEEATPKSLPQTPVVKKIKSDAEDSNLKGKVKMISISEEDFSGTWVTKGIKMASETFFDEKGSRVKYIYYDYRGNPTNVKVFGFINKMRVSQSGFIDYSYNPPPMMPSTGQPKSKNSADEKYNTRYEYKYDDKQRLIEEITYRSNGNVIDKTVYSYNENRVEKTWYNQDGKLYSKVIDLLDEKLNIKEHSFIYVNSSKSDAITVYTYDSFDEKGNWTKRTIKAKDVENNSNTQSHYVEYRTITYY